MTLRSSVSSVAQKLDDWRVFSFSTGYVVMADAEGLPKGAPGREGLCNASFVSVMVNWVCHIDLASGPCQQPDPFLVPE